VELELNLSLKKPSEALQRNLKDILQKQLAKIKIAFRQHNDRTQEFLDRFQNIIYQNMLVKRLLLDHLVRELLNVTKYKEHHLLHLPLCSLLLNIKRLLSIIDKSKEFTLLNQLKKLLFFSPLSMFVFTLQKSCLFNFLLSIAFKNSEKDNNYGAF